MRAGRRPGWRYRQRPNRTLRRKLSASSAQLAKESQIPLEPARRHPSLPVRCRDEYRRREDLGWSGRYLPARQGFAADRTHDLRVRREKWAAELTVARWTVVETESRCSWSAPPVCRARPRAD